MTIHHDKKAYGKLASMREELSEERILKMLEELGGEEEDENAAPGKRDAVKPKEEKSLKKS